MSRDEPCFRPKRNRAEAPVSSRFTPIRPGSSRSLNPTLNQSISSPIVESARQAWGEIEVGSEKGPLRGCSVALSASKCHTFVSRRGLDAASGATCNVLLVTRHAQAMLLPLLAAL
jgi:hypothetical protein